MIAPEADLAPAWPPYPGDRVAGRFEIEREAGAGGMAVVYRARDRHSGARVALKAFREPITEAGMQCEEANLLAQIDHPGVVRYLDHGVTEEGHGYLVTEWLEGEDLGSRLMRGPLDTGEALALLRRVASALTAVHGQCIVHRDLKPSNIFLVGGMLERPKIIDMGLAGYCYASLRLAQACAGFGTPPYMAPEQIRGDVSPGPAADVYALGCVLFECLTGRTPFTSDRNAMALMVKALFEEAPHLAELRADVPPAVDELVARMLAKDPAERPEDAQALVDALAALAPGNDIERESRLPLPSLTGNEVQLVGVVLAAPSRESLARVSCKPPPMPAGGTLPVPTALARTSPLDALSALATRHGARIEILRDGWVAALITGAPSPTDMAVSAARCSLSIRALGGGGRVALATGWDVIAGEQPIGRVIDRAAALLEGGDDRAQAGEGNVVLDPMTAALLGERFLVTTSGGNPALLGERAPVEMTRKLLGKPAPFLGRERELGLLEEVFDACAAGPSARAVLVTAGAGLGKSRLCQELLGRLSARGGALSVWVASGDPMAAGAPLGMLRRLVRHAARLQEGEDEERKRQKLGAWVGRRLEEPDRARVTEFLGEMAGVHFVDDASVQLRAARRDPVLMGDQIRRAWLDLLDAECEACPVVLILEDLHWGDAPTLECMSAALRMLGDRPLLLLSLARPEVKDKFPGLFADHAPVEVQLGELSPGACHAFVREVLGEDLPDEAITRIVERSTGNAFFLEELVRAAAEGHKGEVPETVLAMMQARLATLPPAVRRALRAASVFGPVFWRGALGALLGPSACPIDESLAELERRELVSLRPEATFSGEAEYAFRHALVREAAYGMLTDQDRALGHRLAGAWLERAGVSDAAMLAAHFERGGLRARAAAAHEKAAAQALAVSDLDATLASAARAVACGAKGSVLGSVRRLEAEVHTWRGDFAEGAQRGREAMGLLSRGTPPWYAAAAALSWAALARGDHEELLRVARELCRTAFEGPPEAPQLVVFARVLMGLYRAGLVEAATPLVDALRGAPEALLRDPIVAANLEEFQAFRATYAGDRASAYESFRAAAEGFSRAGDVRNQLRAAVNAALLRMLLGEHAEAALDLREALALSVRLGLDNMTATIKENLGLALSHEGSLEEARRLEEEAIAAFTEQGDRGLLSVARSYLAGILLRLGRMEEARRQAVEAVELVAATPSLRCQALAVLAQVELTRGSEALGYAEEAMRLFVELGSIEEGEALVRLVFAEALLQSGATTRGREALRAARDALLAAAGSIREPERRRRFLWNVPEHARTLELASRWLA